MRSSGGQHFVGLDHLRAVAVFLVAEWHFTHSTRFGQPADYTPAFWPSSFIEESYIGVSLFMVLSGYLFAKLLDGREPRWGWFLWNRAIRLAPLLILAIFISAVFSLDGLSTKQHFWNALSGAAWPTLPNGGWSITAEMHFYLLLPILLPIFNRHWLFACGFIIALLVLRAVLLTYTDHIQYLAYKTIVGRADQFALGICAYAWGGFMRSNHRLMAVGALAYVGLLHWFNSMGGFYRAPEWPWVFMGTADAAFFAMLVSYYDRTFRFENKGVSRLVAIVGETSYSMYLLHYFFVFELAQAYYAAFPGAGFYEAFAVGALAFVIFTPTAWVSYRFIERPFLRLRKPYLAERPVLVDDRSKAMAALDSRDGKQKLNAATAALGHCSRSAASASAAN